ncbi:MAG: M23 family metallopeptidase [Lewinella sp.]|nr:M23 family metallopeptidase [Lewinella sp.]
MWRFAGLIIVIAFLLSGREPAAIPDFAPPVQGGMQLTGTFGELRGNHFHAGLDIRGAVGRPVYAVADGFVARIVVKGGGYGQALYLDHPSGHTSLYGHLDRFREDIATFVKRRQYDLESFELDEELNPAHFPVRQGDLIGYIGKRGFAFGPHLHFELRDRETQDPLNPMSFGLDVADTRPPFVEAIRLYELDERGNPLRGESQQVRRLASHRYTTAEDTLWVNGPSFGLAVKAYDQQNSLNNWNGIYQMALRQDDSLRFAFAFERYGFDKTRYLNAHLDFEEQQQGSWFHRCFRLPGNQLKFYRPSEDGGRLQLAPGEASRVTIEISDKAGNQCTVEAVVKRRARPLTPIYEQAYVYQLPYDEESVIDNGSFRAHFAPFTFYEDLYFQYTLVPEKSAGIYSAVHQLHDHLTPVHRYFDLQIRPNEIAPALRKKAIIAYCADGNNPYSFGGEWTSENRLRARVRALGNYSIMVDTIGPRIRPERWSGNMRGWEQFSFRISDNFPTAGDARDLRFRAEVDGTWILMEYDAKTARLYHVFDGIISRGEHRLKLTVTDDRENTTLWEGTFVL